MIKNNNNLKKWLEEKLPHLGNLNKIKKFDVGQSNPTYLLYCENKKIVLNITMIVILRSRLTI